MATMKALVYGGPGKKEWKDMPKATIKAPTDAVIKITHTTICGTDLHILKGDVPTCKPGTILGHEGVGVVEETGSSVTEYKKGDKVLIACISACGHCEFCKRKMYSHCATGGWILGNEIDGTQAEYVRVPHADMSLYPVPKGADEEAIVMLSDIFPTGYECGVLNGQVTPGCTVAIVGAGPVGLAALMTAQFLTPSEIIMVDLDDNRLKVSKEFGATQLLNSKIGNKETAKKIKEMTEGKGVDVAIEAVGIPATFELCQDILAPGGRLANVGVHGVPCPLHLETLWCQNVTVTTRLVDTETTGMMLKTVNSGKIHPEKLVTHRFKLDEIIKAYDVFTDAAGSKSLKVILRP